MSTPLPSGIAGPTFEDQAPGALPPPLPLGRPIRRRIGRRVFAVAVLGAACLWLILQRDVKYYRVTSGSMEPTLQIDQRVAVDTGTHEPAVGDIVVFHPPTGASPTDPTCGLPSQGASSDKPCGLPGGQESRQVFIKRVVAGPGDTISLIDGRAIRNGHALDEPYIGPCNDQRTCNFPDAVTVPAGEYYVLGDNRGVSDDSRFWGPVPSAWIIGTAVHCSFFQTLCHARR